MQFLVCRFSAVDTRRYTYHNDGEPVAVGDFVKIAGRKLDEFKRVEVVAISDHTPNFETKPIFGKAEPRVA